MVAFDLEAAKRRAAQLGQLLGPIIVKGCGKDDMDGEVYYTDLTVAEDRKLRMLERSKKDTFHYREMILRAKDADGNRIWDDNEIHEVLSGGVDPMDVAYIVGSMYAGERYKINADGPSGPFDKNAAKKMFTKSTGLYGPVNIAHLGKDGADLPFYYTQGDGYEDCAIAALRRKHPDDYELRILIKRALNVNGEPIFTDEHFATLASALTSKEITKIMSTMMHPRFMSDEDRIRLAVAVESNPQLDVDDLKN